MSCAATLGAATSASASTRAAKLRVVSISPSFGTKNVGGTSPITIRFSAPVLANSAIPVVNPQVAGSWSAKGRLLVFTPLGGYPPDSEITVSIPGGAAGVVGVDGARLNATDTVKFTTEGGSIVRAEQLLAELGYLPVTWHQRRPIVRTETEFERAVYDAPHGRFVFLGDAPQALRALWSPGSMSQIFKSSLVSFDRAENLAPQSGMSSGFWSTLLRVSRRPSVHRNSAGFTYALVNKNVGNNRPETLTIYQDGRVVLESLANTGISASPTEDGTFAVYLRFENQVMSGTSPFGGTYSDPVSWVAYFNGSDAVHYIARSQYGYPQSFGCVELPWTEAERTYGLLQLGALVTVQS